MSKPDPGKVARPAPAVPKLDRAAGAAPLKGKKKSQAIDNVTGQIAKANLTVRRVLEVGLNGISEGMGLEIWSATVMRTFGANADTVARVAKGNSVKIVIDGVVGATYLLDCGVTGSSNFDFFVFENGAGGFTGSSRVSAGRLLFAHAYTAQEANFIAFNISSSTAFTFSGCEITELAEPADPRASVAPAASPKQAVGLQ